jgi:hypothetical protein
MYDARMTDEVVEFRPSRVEGVSDTTDVRVYRDHLELDRNDGRCRRYEFVDMARGRELATGRIPIGELHFSRTCYPDSHFVFYTSPPIKIYMPTDGPTRMPESHFWRVQEILRAGGFRLYDDGPPKRPLMMLNPSPTRTLLYVAIVLAVCWSYALSGFLPGTAGAIARDHLLHFPRRSKIGISLVIPAMFVPMIIALRHGRNGQRIALIIVIGYALALLSEWSLRRTVHSWAPIELPPHSIPFWSAYRFAATMIVVIIGAIAGASLRSAFLEPIHARNRNKSAAGAAAPTADVKSN